MGTENVTYTPPALPAHVAAKLEPVSGLPSNEDVMKVQNAIRLYQKFSDIPNMFDPQSYADLSQHLFNIQMERYMRSRGPTQAYFIPLPTAEAGPTSSETIERGGEQANLATNNPGSGANGIESHWPPQFIHDVGTRDAMERSNQLAERANLLAERSNVLIERSNQIAERANQLAQQSNQTAECLNRDTKRFNELFEHLGQHLERSEQYYGQSTRFTQELTHPLVKIGDVLKNINKVLVGIQHAIVRNRRGNDLGALDCLVNEKGETPGESDVTSKASSNFPG
ncbi:hypothetical protein FRC11_006879 [Ceratobasidium sp. 423]|nr:hypothetical protein FRC11_006879 [Ceratobasidium sp. 423]